MAPKKQAKPKTQSSDVTSQETSQSQDPDASLMQELMSNHKQQVKQRRQKRREALLTATNTRIDGLHREIAQTVQAHEEEIRVIRQRKLGRLLGLHKQKSGLEEKIDQVAAEIEQAFAAAAERVGLAVDRRIEELSR